jgi:hypothetical protein
MTAIELRLTRLSQLYQTLDPSPFRDTDLDSEAEHYIASAADDAPAEAPLEIIVLLPVTELEGPRAADTPEAVRGFFGRGVERMDREISDLFRSGRWALAIGLAILAVCLGLSLLLTSRFGETGLARVLQESLIIVGWVAIWRPAEIFLYDWIPIARQRRLYRRLASCEVKLVAGA